MPQRVGLVLLGLVTAFAGALVHRHGVDVAGLDVPWGLLLALWTTTVVAWACASLVNVGAAWFGLGWTLTVLLQQSVRSGSYLVAGDVVGWTFMAAGLALIAAVLVLHPRRGRRKPSPRRPAESSRPPTSLER